MPKDNSFTTLTNHSDNMVNPHQVYRIKVVTWIGMLINVLLSIFKILRLSFEFCPPLKNRPGWCIFTL